VSARALAASAALAALGLIAACGTDNPAAPSAPWAPEFNVATRQVSYVSTDNLGVPGCDGSVLVGLVTLAGVTHYTFDPASGFAYQFVDHQNWSGTVTADDGTQYTFRSQQTYSERFTPPLGAGEFRQFTYSATLRLTGPGPLNASLIRFTHHIVFSASGVAVTILKGAFECH
jgi:hypothetical protein